MEIDAMKKLTFKRILNAFRIVSSYQLSLLTRKPVVWGHPIFFFIEPTNRCNFQCPECASGLGALTRPLGMMQTQFFRSLVDQIAEKSLYLQLYLQGEPYLNKNLYDMIPYAQTKGLYVVVSTNGSFISGKNVERIVGAAPDKLVFSMDGLDEETYQNYRIGGTFAAADKALRLLVETKKRLGATTPYIELQFIVMKQNEHQAKEVLKYGRELGVDKVTLKTMQVSTPENARHFLPKNEKYRRYVVDGETFRMKGRIKNRCFALWQTSVVTWDGTVVPCCFDKDAEYPLGNLKASNFEEIWQSAQYNIFRQKVLENRKGVPMCTNCTSGLKMNVFETEF
jgi:radical SAM protein with 4Fe4S-binding SPASM domain